jgi:hypothetical protein
MFLSRIMTTLVDIFLTREVRVLQQIGMLRDIGLLMFLGPTLIIPISLIS